MSFSLARNCSEGSRPRWNFVAEPGHKLSSKFGDIYPMSGYEDNSVVSAAVNGLHSEINGEGENVALKAGVSSTLICYFEQCLRLVVNFPAEFLDDETDIHYEWVTSNSGSVLCTVPHSFPNTIFFCPICTFPPQSPHITSSSSSSEGDEEEADGSGEPPGQQEELSSGKTNSPPPSYNHQQVLPHF